MRSEEQALPARSIGKEWRLLRAAIERWLSLEEGNGASKAAQLAAAGTWKDDTLVDEELNEIYRRRKSL